MLVLKDGSQKDLQEEITLRPDRKTHTTQKETLHWLSNLELGGHSLNWLMHQELGHQFCWITNLEIHDANTSKGLAKKGRLRWKIENEGFNAEKNHGYALEHKFSQSEF